MKEEDLDFAESCVREAGWQSETRDTFAAFLAFCADGCFIADSDAKLLGVCVAVPYRRSGFVGELIVQPRARGSFVGPALFKKAIDFLCAREIRSISLDGVAAAAAYYETAGFVRVCRSLRFLGAPPPLPSSDVRSMTEEDLETVCRMDLESWGEARGFFLERRFRHSPQFCHVHVGNGAIDGYIMAAPGRGVIAVGPWIFRGRRRQALSLIQSLACVTQGVPLRIGVLESNRTARRLIADSGWFHIQAPSWRMVRGGGPTPGLNADCLAVGSPAKG